MKVIFLAPQKLGNRSYAKGPQVVPDNLAHNLGFKQLVRSGEIQMLPRDSAAQKIQLSHDAKALQKAKQARQQAHQSAIAAGSDQALQKAAKPVLAEAELKALEPAASLTASPKPSKR